MTETENQAEDCPRCGSLLPDSDEGLCPTCGYEFGRATLYMPVVRLEDVAQADDLPEGVLDAPAAPPAGAPAPMVPAPPPMSIPAEDSSRKVLLIVLLVIIVSVVIMIGAAMILLFTTVDGQPAGEGAAPPAVEQTIDTPE